MEPFDALSLCAEVTIAILGFSGIIVVFGRDALDGLGLGLFQTLFRGTLIPLGIIAVASILDAAALEEHHIWRVCSALHALAISAILLYGFTAGRRTTERPPGFQLAFVGAFAALGLSIWNALDLQSFWPVLTVVWWAMAVSVFAFVGLIFLKRPEEEDVRADSA